jgi:hypothetical protein
MRIQVSGISRDPQFHDHVIDRVRSVLERAQVRTGTASVTFTDANGPKGGPATRCTLVVGIPGRGPLRIAELAASHDLAFTQSLAAFERKLTEQQDRRRDLARRPKKYFAAKRLLADGADVSARRRGARLRDRRP